MLRSGSDYGGVDAYSWEEMHILVLVVFIILVSVFLFSVVLIGNILKHVMLYSA